MDSFDLGLKRTWDDTRSNGSIGEGSSGNGTERAGDSTAATSALPTPTAEQTFPIPVESARLPPPAKKMKVKFGTASTTLPASKATLDKRRDNFFRAHADVYLPLLPPKNHVLNLLGVDGKNKNKVWKEDVPYRRLEQPKSIVGGTMKSYQLEGLSFLAYMYENGQNCILADEYVPPFPFSEQCCFLLS